MNIRQSAAISIRLLLTLFLIAAPLNAQRRRPATPKPPPPQKVAQPALTFETILAADSYKIYGEVRGVGQLLRSAGVSDIVDPVMKLAAPPKEFKTLVRWLNSHADELMTSRLMFAGWPSRPNLPQALFVIEFPSTEEAQKFEPHLKAFLPKFLPTPAPESSASPSPGKSQAPNAGPKETSPPPPSYVLKQSGALVFISESQFTFKALRPPGSKLLAEDPNFRQLHDRLNSESLFLYFDIAMAEKQEEEEALKRQEEHEKRIAEYKKESEKEAAEQAATAPEINVEDMVTPDDVPQEPPPAELGPPQPGEPQLGTTTRLESREMQSEEMAARGMGLDMLFTSFFFGRPVWPEAVGVAIAFDAESYIVRALLVDRPESKGKIIPFASQLVAGPPVAPDAASVFPANTELMVTLSLDLPQMYEGMLKAAASRSEIVLTRSPAISASQPESPFAAYEKKLGLKIKDDVLPLFGSEIALTVPVKTLGVSGPASSPSPTPDQTGDAGATKEAPASPGVQPVVAIAIKDREAVRALIPKIVDAIGFKGASQLAQTEKRDDTELVTIAEAISYAFIGNFLVISPDKAAVRNAVDAYLNRQTLAGNSGFRNSTRWQPRQLLGQVYVSPALMESYTGLSRDLNLISNEAFRDFLSRLSPTSEPVTFAISNEGLGPLHELHIPKNLVLLMIAGIASENSQPPLAKNEAMAQSALRMIHSAETTYQATKGDGNFGTLDQMVEEGLVTTVLFEHGYKIDLTVSGTKFEATAVPLEYGKTGKISFFIDESGVIRGVDNGGSAATAADKPMQ